MSGVSPVASDLERELNTLEAELKRLEAEYNRYFAGGLPRPPWETRSRVESMVRRIDRMQINNTGARFRFSTLQSRFSTFVELWNRAFRAREEGRSGPFVHPHPVVDDTPTRTPDRTLAVTTFTDPLQEMDKVRELYDSLTEARREVGEDAMPFHAFADLVKTQVGTLKEKGSAEVMFRVAVTEGKVAFSARAMKVAEDEEG